MLQMSLSTFVNWLSMKLAEKVTPRFPQFNGIIANKFVFLTVSVVEPPNMRVYTVIVDEQTKLQNESAVQGKYEMNVGSTPKDSASFKAQA